MSAILFISCWFFCILFLYNAYICFRMHFHINEAGIFAIEKKTDSENAEMASFLFAMSLCRRKAKPFAKMMKRISFIHLCAKERDSANPVIYTLLGADSPQACVRTEEGATRYCNIRPRCINVKTGWDKLASFRVWVFISKSRLERTPAQSPGLADVRYRA